MSFRHLNLARRPFLNARPVARAGMGLCILGALLLLINLVLYWGYLSTSGERRDQLATARQEIDTISQEVQELSRAPEFTGLVEYNERVAGLNELIAQRTFPWSRLFGRIAEVLPAGVKLEQLTPSLDMELKEERSGALGSPGPELVALALVGEARSDEQLYRFVDALFADPAFRDPNLQREALNGGGLSFTLDVLCDPAALLAAEEPKTDADASKAEEPKPGDHEAAPARSAA